MPEEQSKKPIVLVGNKSDILESSSMDVSTLQAPRFLNVLLASAGAALNGLLVYR